MDGEQETGFHGNHKDRFSTVFIASLVAALAPLNFGYALGYTSPIQTVLEDTTQKFHVTDEQFSWFGSLVAIGAILGSILGGWMIDHFGRKVTLMLTGIPYTIGWLLVSYASSVHMLYIGRIFVGVAVGISSLTTPTYISEISSARLRGGLGSINQLAVVTGILLAYVIGARVGWRWAAIMAVGLVATLVLLMAFMPETPRWLLANNQRHRAIKELEWLRGPLYDVEEECFEIESNLDQQQTIQVGDFKEPSLLRPLLMGCGLMIFQQFCGINVVLFYNAKIFKGAGVSDPQLVTIFVSLSQFVATFVACLIVDKTGRRILLMVGGAIMFICMFLLGVYFDLVVVTDKSEKVISIFGKYSHTIPVSHISWLAIGSVIVYIVFFSLGWGPLPWLLMSEIFPPRAKAMASGMVTLVNWLFVFIVTKSFKNLKEALYDQGTFWFFSAFSLASVFFTMFVVFETKGKTLEEIEEHFSNSNRTENE